MFYITFRTFYNWSLVVKPSFKKKWEIFTFSLPKLKFTKWNQTWWEVRTPKQQFNITYICSLCDEATHKHEILEMLLSAAQMWVQCRLARDMRYYWVLNGPSSFVCQRLGHWLSTISIGVCIPLAFLWTHDVKYME